MLCRAILTAIAISCMFSRETPVRANDLGSPRLDQIKDVICVLLLSGLQKEDLDVNTLEKLRRHHVNIYDMNNESLRQECMIKSLSGAKSIQDLELTVDTANTAAITNKQGLHDAIAKAGIQEQTTSQNDFQHKTNILDYINEMKNMMERQNNRNDNQQKPENTNKQVKVTKDENNNLSQTQYVKSQPSLESVLNFWTKLQHNKETTVEISTIATTVPSEKPSTLHNDNGYVHSREMEYVNRLIADYLSSRTEPTTTQANENKLKKIDLVTKKLNELMAKTGNNKEITDLADLGKIIQIDNQGTSAPMPSSVSNKLNNYEKNEELERLRVIPHNPIINNKPNTQGQVTAQDIETLKYFTNLLHLTKQWKNNNSLISYPVTSRKDLNIKNEEKVKHNEYANNTILLEQVQKKGFRSDQGPVSPEVIQSIAEKVKEIMMKDITTTATIPTTITIVTEPTTLAYKEARNIEMEKIIELLNKLKYTTNAPITVKKTTFPTQPAVRIFPPVPAGLDPYGLGGQVFNRKPFQADPYGQNLVPIPMNPADRIARGHITMQTNSLEIPPLGVQVSNPMPIMNQHILVTTQNPFNTNKGVLLQRESKIGFDDKTKDVYGAGKGRNYAEQITYTDIANLNIDNINNNFREAQKERLQQIEGRMNQVQQYNRPKAEELGMPPDSGPRVESRLAELANSGLGQIAGTGQNDDLKLPWNINKYYVEALNRPQDLNQQETFKKTYDSNRQGQSWPQDTNLQPPKQPMNLYENDNRPINSKQHEAFSEAMVDPNRGPLNRPGRLNKYDQLHPPEFARQNILSTLTDSSHQEIIGRLMQQRDRMSDVNNYQTRNQHFNAFDRISTRLIDTQPHYKGVRYHEELERMGNVPGNHVDINNNNLVSRQLMPINKIKQRQKYDDKRFRNFLKSQQKVTDILERMLATKIRTNS